MIQITISESEISRLIEEELGFSEYIDKGETGREYNERWFNDRLETIKERAECPLYEVAERAFVLTDDDFSDAALDGIRQWLAANKGDLQAKLNAAADEMKAELLASPLYWVVWAGQEPNTAVGWINRRDAERDLRAHLEGFDQGGTFVRHPEARLVEGPNSQIGETV